VDVVQYPFVPEANVSFREADGVLKRSMPKRDPQTQIPEIECHWEEHVLANRCELRVEHESKIHPRIEAY
jgi:hypothetical protein